MNIKLMISAALVVLTTFGLQAEFKTSTLAQRAGTTKAVAQKQAVLKPTTQQAPKSTVAPRSTVVNKSANVRGKMAPFNFN